MMGMRCAVLTRPPHLKIGTFNMADQRPETECRLQAAAALAIDCAAAAKRIEAFLQTTLRKLNRRGCVVGVSGGVDSALCAHLAARAIGPDRVIALLMPERESSEGAGARARRLCESLGIRYFVEDISSSLEAIGCYRRRDGAIRMLFPDYGAGWRQKIVITGGGSWTPHFKIVVESPTGQSFERRMPADIYLQVVAATNFKQRIRKSLEYYHAESLNYAVVGTPNRLEYELGFFVRGGDGLADLKPIAHLYKTQVYALAEYLEVPEEIRFQPPSTDTYSLPQTQEEFYFALSYQDADIVLYGMCSGFTPSAIASALGREPVEIERVVRDFEGKRLVASRTLREAFIPEGEP
jgi:NAD+ synthase